jgi:diadenosine tetraphosphate (Ap4A) HIT family hydrolase
MKYADYLKNHTGCPFCELAQEKFITLPHAYLTFALAPYHEHHLLIIPTRHVESYVELTPEEREDMHELLLRGIQALKNVGYTDYTILLRDGGATYKSVPHLHINLIPCDAIGSLTHDGKERSVLEQFEIESLTQSVRKALAVSEI